MSALSRMAMSEHRKVKVTPNDFIIISARPIPGNEKFVNRVVNELLQLGAEVIYEKMYDVHVSGHACQDEQKTDDGSDKTKIYSCRSRRIQHDENMRWLQNRWELMKIMSSSLGTGAGNRHGEVFRLGGEVPSGAVMVDGLGVGDVGSIVLRDRKHLAEDGLIVVVAAINTKTKKDRGWTGHHLPRLCLCQRS